LLVEGGHRVTGLTRDTNATGMLRALGAEPVVADAFDADALTEAVSRASPDVLMHQLTDLSSGSLAANAAIRLQGTASLMRAAQTAGVRRIIAQSIAWAYAPGDDPAAESVPLDLGAPEPRHTSVAGIAALETGIGAADEWVALRYGLLYGPDTWYRPGGSRADDARDGKLAAGPDVSSFIHVGDAATAAVLALDWPTGPVNVCDDDPAPSSEWTPVFCAAVGAPAPPHADGERPGWARGADNSYARSELGWLPVHRTWREGFNSMR
jgi:nucleoside-diphosphate-sugar epimerase